jgi:hypothetical protein
MESRPPGDHDWILRMSAEELIEQLATCPADIEDLLDPGLYLQLVNGTYAERLGMKLTLKDLGTPGGGDPRIAKRIERYFDNHGLGRFSHYPPASFLLRNQATLVSKLSDRTVERARQLFARINSTLPEGGAPAPSVVRAAARRKVRARASSR